MNQEMVKVTIDGKEHEYAIGTTYREIVDEYQEEVAEAPAWYSLRRFMMWQEKKI